MKGKFQNISWPVSIYMYKNELLQYRGEQWKAVDAECEKRFKIPVCILTKENYIEVTKRYPINNLAHLYQVVRVEAKAISPFGASVLWAITGHDSKLKTYTVTYWALKELPTEVSDKFRWYIPESLLLKYSVQPSVAYRIECDSPKYFIHNQVIGTKVVSEDSLVPTIQRFTELVSNGIAVQTATLSNREYESTLALIAKKLPPSAVFGLYLASEKSVEFSFDEYKWPAAVMASLLILYGSGVSVYQNHNIEKLRATVEGKQLIAEQVIDNERKALQHMAKWNQYLDLRSDYPGLTKVYAAIMVPLSETQAELTNIQVQGNMVSLYGLSPSATKTFEQIASVSEFSDVKLDGNINVDRRTEKERFIIKLKYEGAKQ